MKFLIQSNLLSNQQLEMTKYVMDTYDAIDCAIIPFSEEITTTEPLDGLDYFPYGSTSLSNIALSRGFTGLHLNLAKFDVAVWHAYNKRNMLNLPLVMSAERAIEFLLRSDHAEEMVFMRPCQDLKQFSGAVDTHREHGKNLESMVDSYIRGFPGSYSMNPETNVALSIPKNILGEWRWFIVGGKIISGSLYKAHKQLRQIRETDPTVISEAQKLAEAWLPDQCCVMDTGLTENGEVKIIEFNTINSSGFYDNDVPAIFDAIAAYHNIKRK